MNKPKYSKLIFSWTFLAVLCFSAQAAYSEVITRTYQVSASGDDAHAYNDTSSSTNSLNVTIGDNGSITVPYFMFALRFIDIDISHGAYIINAHLEFESIFASESPPVYSLIQAEDTDDASDFSSRYLSEIIKTGTSVNWDILDTWQNDTWYTSVDFAAVIQERTIARRAQEQRQKDFRIQRKKEVKKNSMERKKLISYLKGFTL